jgi:hypothetical protein
MRRVYVLLLMKRYWISLGEDVAINYQIGLRCGCGKECEELRYTFAKSIESNSFGDLRCQA